MYRYRSTRLLSGWIGVLLLANACTADAVHVQRDDHWVVLDAQEAHVKGKQLS